ncbi:Ribose 5-phosphate isomerase B [Bacillus badius]|nr:Ribose 5-phosphate isomerase B [Bacillus badius]
MSALLIGIEGTKTPAGSAGQERPRRRFSAEEARRPPRGKRSSLEWKSTARIHKSTKKQGGTRPPCFLVGGSIIVSF